MALLVFEVVLLNAQDFQLALKFLHAQIQVLFGLVDFYSFALRC